MHSHILILLEYNFWANDLFITRLKDLSHLPEDTSRLLGHILNAHLIWLGRIQQSVDLIQPWQDTDPSEWEELNIWLYNETSDIVKSKSLETRVSYKNTKGNLYENSIGEMIFHLINHSSHHRGQIAVKMRDLAVPPPASDFIFYLRR